MNKPTILSETIDRVIAGECPRFDMVQLSAETPELMQQLGFAALPITITQKHLMSVMRARNADKPNDHSHGISKEMLIDLVSALSEPAMVLQSYRNPERAIIVSDKKDNDNCPIFIILHNDGFGDYQGKRIKTNVVTSIYGKENFDRFLNDALRNNELMYCDKEKSRNLLRQAENSFPRELADYDYNIIIRKLVQKVNSTYENILSLEEQCVKDKLLEIGKSKDVAEKDAKILTPVAKKILDKQTEQTTQKENQSEPVKTAAPESAKSSEAKIVKHIRQKK